MSVREREGESVWGLIVSVRESEFESKVGVRGVCGRGCERVRLYMYIGNSKNFLLTPR